MAAGSYYTWHWYQNKPKPVDVAPLVVQDISASVQRPSAVNYNRNVSWIHGEKNLPDGENLHRHAKTLLAPQVRNRETKNYHP